MSELLDNIRSARASGVPLLAIVTQDQPTTVETIGASLTDAPRISWDCINGLRPLNEPGKAALVTLGEGVKDSARPTLALKLAAALPPKSALFLYNAHSFLHDPSVVQSVQNLREAYKENKRTLLLLGSDFETMRRELHADVVTLEEPLPTDEQLGALIADLHESAAKTMDKAKLPQMIDAVRGLPALWTVEQNVAMSFRKAGLDMGALWNKQSGVINSTDGLTITRGGLSYADLAGMDTVMEYLRGFRKHVRLVLFWDEIEKMMAGAGNEAQDGSGVSSDFLNVCLKVMQKFRWMGLILFGVPGSGKTALAEATAAEFDVPRIEMDFGAMKGRYVGDSESAVRKAFKMVEGIGGSQVLVIATCNRLRSLPAEFRRRFWLGNFYFDVPSLPEQEPIKRIYEKKCKLTGKQTVWPDTTNWTGSEIRNCAELAVLRDTDLKKAAEFIVPIATADPESVENLREIADGRFLSVNSPGRWKREQGVNIPVPTKGKRRIES